MTDPRLLAADRLEAAAYVVMLPKWHCKHALARAADGMPLYPDFKEAASFCAVGAYDATAGKRYAFWASPDAMRVTDNLARKRGFEGLVKFNNHPDTTPQEVASLMLDAADALRKEVGGANA